MWPKQTCGQKLPKLPQCVGGKEKKYPKPKNKKPSLHGRITIKKKKIIKK